MKFNANQTLRDKGFATNLPQAQTDRFRQWRISAGYSGPVFCGKNGPEGPFVTVIIH